MADDSGRILTIHLLGGLRIMAGDEGVAGLHHARLQELLAYLLLQRGRPVSRQHLAFLFWPDSPEKQARTNLRNLWHRLRRTLPDAERFIDTGEAAIQWRSDAPYTLDVAGFEAALAQARGASPTPFPTRARCAPPSSKPCPRRWPNLWPPPWPPGTPAGPTTRAKNSKELSIWRNR